MDTVVAQVFQIGVTCYAAGILQFHADALADCLKERQSNGFLDNFAPLERIQMYGTADLSAAVEAAEAVYFALDDIAMNAATGEEPTILELTLVQLHLLWRVVERCRKELSNYSDSATALGAYYLDNHLASLQSAVVVILQDQQSAIISRPTLEWVIGQLESGNTKAALSALKSI